MLHAFRLICLSAILFMASTATIIATTAGAQSPAQPTDAPNTATAIFAGGCFWCMEPPYDKMDGVLSTTSGYTGGKLANPTYKQVSAGRSGHYEALKVTYDPSVVSYEKLLSAFWHNIDPLNSRGQFCDTGRQYRSAIFYNTPEQKELAEASKQDVAKRLRRRVATDIIEATEFYDAEEYHQDYYIKNPLKYKFYRYQCGRDARLDALWGRDARHAN